MIAELSLMKNLMMTHEKIILGPARKTKIQKDKAHTFGKMVTCVAFANIFLTSIAPLNQKNKINTKFSSYSMNLGLKVTNVPFENDDYQLGEAVPSLAKLTE